MKLGDLVQYKESFWIVRRHDPKRTRTTILVAASGQSEEIPCDADVKGQATVTANPSSEWPFVTLKERPRLGRIQRIAKLSLTAWDGSRSSVPIELPLEAHKHWVASDPMRCGGPIFFSPTLELKAGETLTALFERGQARIIIPGSFTTVKARIEKATPKPREPKTAYNHLLDEDDL